ncbi:MAG: 5'/3'-nucleotidase SurE [Firmicutes bacterium]|nr:5'/3'-nucleotidase SurE [Bacillota bacterium]
MNILISNDDGIDAIGIKKLVEAMGTCADIYVVAPDTQRSASSHALSLRKEITVREVEFPGAKYALECNGTPADCVKLGLDLLKKKGIHMDAVYAGINLGANLGTDNMYSGTVSAAAEGMLEGIPAVAVSVCSHDATYFEGACKLAVDVLPIALEAKGRLGVISINTPDIPMENIKGVKPAKLGTVEYDQVFEEISRGNGTVTYKYTGEPIEIGNHEDDLDVKLINDGYATISAIKYDLNDYAGLKEMEKWELKI